MNKFAATLATVACCTAYGYAQAPLFYPASPVAVGQGSGEVFLVDLNRDGHLDLITKHLVQRKLTVFSGDGKGHFVPAAEGSMDFDVMPGAVALGDVNNDGVFDLGVSSKVGTNERVHIFLGNRAGGFNPAFGRALPVGASTEGRDYKPVLRFADLNEDGKLDLISANERRNSIEIFLGDGQGGFSAGPIVQLGQGGWNFSFAVGDLDADGHLDLATSIRGESPESHPASVEIRRGDGKGGFAVAPDQTLPVAPDPIFVAIVDLNNDGHGDIVLSHGHTNILSIFLNDGKGVLTPGRGPAINIGWPAWEFLATDINGDKNVDLIATTVESNAPFASKVVVLLGDGHGEFTTAPGSPFPVMRAAYRLTVGDVNQDGKLDIAASGFGSDGVTLLLGR